MSPGSDRFDYALDGSDVIVSLGEAWLRFARENGAPELCRESVVGRSLWEYVTGDTTRQLYQAIFRRVRDRGETLVLPFRCDSPERFRFMELAIGCGEGSELRALWATAARAGPSPLPAARSPGDAIVGSPRDLQRPACASRSSSGSGSRRRRRSRASICSTPRSCLRSTTASAPDAWTRRARWEPTTGAPAPDAAPGPGASCRASTDAGRALLRPRAKMCSESTHSARTMGFQSVAKHPRLGLGG